MRSSIKIVLFLALPCTLLGVLFGISIQMGVFQVREVKLEIQNTTDEYFQTVSTSLRKDLEKYRNQNIWDVDLSAINERVQQESWVQRAAIRKQIPREVHIEIIPNEVRAVYVSSRGRAIPVSAQGDFMSEVPLQKAPLAPILRDIKFFRDAELRGRVVKMIDELPVSGALSRSTLAEVSMDLHQQFLLSLMGSGIQIRMNHEDVPLKVGRVTKVLEYLDSKNFQARVIDTDFSKKVLVKLRHRR